jgi:excisionase family DNA binding protein
MPFPTGRRPAARRLAAVQAAAAMYDVDPKTVRRWIASGLITGYRVGDRLVKVDLNEVEAQVVTVLVPASAGDAEPRAAEGGR